MRTFEYKGYILNTRSKNFNSNVQDIIRAITFLYNQDGLTFSKKSLKRLVGDKRNKSKIRVKNASRVRQQIINLCCKKISTDAKYPEYRMDIHGVEINKLAKQVELNQWEIGQKALIDSAIKKGMKVDLSTENSEALLALKIRETVETLEELLRQARKCNMKVVISVEEQNDSNIFNEDGIIRVDSITVTKTEEY